RYGQGIYVRGNPDLVPERGLNADLGAAWTLAGRPGRLVVDGALFAAQSRDLIHFQDRGYFWAFLNVASARVLGAELSVVARTTRGLNLFAQGTFTDARDRSGEAAHNDRLLPQLPRLRGYARPELRGLPLGRGVF